MRRGKSKAGNKSTHALLLVDKFDALRSLKALQKRVATLEREVAELKAPRMSERRSSSARETQAAWTEARPRGDAHA